MSVVCLKLPHECEDITKNALRTQLNAQYNINYNILYSFELPSKSIISLLFDKLSNIDNFFTFLGIDSQPWVLCHTHPPLSTFSFNKKDQL